MANEDTAIAGGLIRHRSGQYREAGMDLQAAYHEAAKQMRERADEQMEKET